ncbi:hypothetical protein HZS_7100 [Henneguya salminicola]|nr:hypothetical protein HZS_7100 [Henneguya salminicola]
MESVNIKKYEEISERMKNTLTNMMELKFLTWIQENSIPHILSGKNTLIKSPSGTGKTLSYAIPIIEMLYRQQPRISRKDGVFVLIVVPTKELAKQTITVFNQVLKNFIWIQVGAVFGEDKRKSEKSRLRKGINILICTPGRLLDHLINTQSLDLSKIKTLVIDEADMLLDLGYEHKMNQIISELKNRFNINDVAQFQIILLSATLNRQVNKLCSSVLDNPVFIDATPFKKMAIAYETLSCNAQLVQTVVIIPTKWRLVALVWFIYYILSQNTGSFKIIVFVCSINSVCYYAAILNEIFEYYNKIFIRFDLNIFQLNGDMEIKERMQVFDQFSSCNSGILISTDVAGRGLDFKDVKWVIQFDPARNPVDYVHRVGRTARAGHDGSAVVFLSPHESSYLEVLKESGMEIGKELDLKQLSKFWLAVRQQREYKDISDTIIENEGSSVHTIIKNIVDQSNQIKQLAYKCFTSSVKSYSSYPQNLKKHFNPRVLHIGHLAESLGLSETPKNIGQISREEISEIQKPFDPKKRTFSKTRLELTTKGDIKRNAKKVSNIKPSVMTVSEYSSSLCSGPVTRKNIKN